MNWVLEDAPDLPPHCFSVLMALASKARENGTAAYPGQDWLADRARKSDRSVRNDLAALEKLGLIRRGDQSIVSHLPADERPVVWDLAVERVRERKPASGRKCASARTDEVQTAKVADQQEPKKARKQASGRKSTTGRKSTSATERKQASAYTSLDTSTTQLPSEAAADEPRHTAETSSANDETPPLVLISGEDIPAQPKKPKARKTRRKPDRTPLDDEADVLTNGYWDRFSKTTAQSWIAVRQVVLGALNNDPEQRNDIARALDALGRDGRPVTQNTLTFALKEVRERRGQQQTGTDGPFNFGPLDNVNDLWKDRR